MTAAGTPYQCHPAVYWTASRDCLRHPGWLLLTALGCCLLQMDKSARSLFSGSQQEAPNQRRVEVHGRSGKEQSPRVRPRFN